MEHTLVPTQNDFDYFLQQDRSETEKIVSGMLALIDANDAKLTAMQNQKWFQCMWFTISGKNKATVEEMEQNRDRLAGYSVQIISKLIDQKRISDSIISSLMIRLNDVYTAHIELQNIVYTIANELKEKIDNVDNYHNLVTDIQNGKYDQTVPFVCLWFSHVSVKEPSGMTKNLSD
jgi:hypothetical protein